MKSVVVYTTTPCPYCTAAKTLLSKRGISYEEINLARDADGRQKLIDTEGRVDRFQKKYQKVREAAAAKKKQLQPVAS